MLFSSQVFILLFLPLSAALFHFVAKTLNARLGLLLCASFVFYAWWDLRFVPLLAGLITFNWYIAHLAERSSAKAWVAFGVAINLLTLGAFKYLNFLVESAYQVIGIDFQPWSIVLPLGISFFTFQQISYLIDLSRGQATRYQFLHYATYVSFFPQLIAGPIVRHNELIPQLRSLEDKISAEVFARGLILFTLGVAKKVFLADELNPFADAGFDAALEGELISPWLAWQSALAYSLQLYFDFSGYSDMAIGLAGMFGLSLPLNFNRPYHAATIREFWRRWHMTLSRFFRDYVYIPLGGSHQGVVRTCLVAFATMLLCGLWHGAGWTFVVWGGLHGLAIVVNRTWSQNRAQLPRWIAWMITLSFVCACWVLFRAETFAAAQIMFQSMFLGPVGGFDDEPWQMIGLAIVFVMFGPTNVEIAARPSLPGRLLTAVLSLLLVAVCLRVGFGREIEFIYFQF